MAPLVPLVPLVALVVFVTHVAMALLAFAWVIEPSVAAADADHSGTHASGTHASGTHASPRAPASRDRFEPPAAGSYALPPIGHVSEHELLDTSGRPAPLLGLAKGELALVSFVYLSCNEACPLATATLHDLDRQLADDPDLAGHVRLVTVSFDPTRDTPERMQALEKSLTPRSPWHFLTANDAGAIAPVLADFGQDAVWIPGPETLQAPDRLRHVLKIFLVDDQRRVRNIYSTGLLDVRLLLNDLRTLRLEPESEGHRGHPAEETRRRPLRGRGRGSDV